MAMKRKGGVSNRSVAQVPKELLKRFHTIGIDKPTASQIANAASIFDQAFISARKLDGVSDATAKRDLNFLKRQGYSQPSAWHGRRVERLADQAYIKARATEVAPDVAKKEIAQTRRAGKRPTVSEAKRRNRMDKRVPGEREITTMEEYLRFIEGLTETETEIEEWVSSVDY